MEITILVASFEVDWAEHALISKLNLPDCKSHDISSMTIHNLLVKDLTNVVQTDDTTLFTNVRKLEGRKSSLRLTPTTCVELKTCEGEERRQEESNEALRRQLVNWQALRRQLAQGSSLMY